MVVLGTEAPIFKELQSSPTSTPFRPSSSAWSRSVATPQQPVMPPPAVAASGRFMPPVATPGRVATGEAEAAAAVTAAVATATSGSVSLKDIARTAAREAERELILRMLTRTRWNRKEAAEILGISYKALLYKIKDSGLDKAS
jgi:two-component system, NtrC family, response regulator AtoC